jgi:hypothetical protein
MTKVPACHPLALAAPSLGLPLTICVLAYGAHSSLARRFLDSLYHHTDPELFQLRAGLNEVELETRRLFQSYAERFRNVAIFAEAKNIFKYPLMRRMFHAPPLPSAWTVWCDDDTHFTRSDWLHRLAMKIERNPEEAMWGQLYGLCSHNPLMPVWIKAASWYRGLPWMRGTDSDGCDGIEFRFATGGFWAVRTAILRQLDWPDTRIIHADGDFLLAEALRQNGLKTGRFDYGVAINDAPRRNPNNMPALVLGVH